MENNIRRLAGAVILCFIVISLALVWWQLVSAEALVSRPDNSRLVDEELSHMRGPIVDRNGKPLVVTEPGSPYPRRNYLYPELAHVTGFNSPRFGATGIENSFRSYLWGEKAATLSWDWLLGRHKEGATVRLTIDLVLQRAAEQALGSRQGAVIALDPKTGEVLAMVSHPTFEANRLAQGSPASNDVDAYWQKLAQDADRPLVNRTTQGLYAPGSTFKTVTLAGALEGKSVSLDAQYHITLNPPDAEHPLPWHRNQYVSCHNHTQTDLSLAEAYGWSCNVIFSEIGLDIGPGAYIDYARRFGLGSRPPLEIDAETSQLFHTANYFGGEERFYALASTAMGQGELSVTPLQMALVAAAIADNGIIQEPYLVAEVTGPDGRSLVKRQPKAWRVAVEAATAAKVRDIMVASVDNGWAQSASVPGVKVAGKTGTAEVSVGTPHAWFIGFAPADNPRLALAVIVENAGYGSAEAAPVARAVFRAALGR